MPLDNGIRISPYTIIYELMVPEASWFIRRFALYLAVGIAGCLGAAHIAQQTVPPPGDASGGAHTS